MAKQKIIKINTETDDLILQCGDMLTKHLDMKMKIPRYAVVDSAMKVYIEHLKELERARPKTHRTAA